MGVAPTGELLPIPSEVSSVIPTPAESKAGGVKIGSAEPEPFVPGKGPTSTCIKTGYIWFSIKENERFTDDVPPVLGALKVNMAPPPIKISPTKFA
jgi:hypothetical protein